MLKKEFRLFLNFQVVAGYGAVNSISCLFTTDVNDSGDFFDQKLWLECGSSTIADYFLGFLLFLFYLIRLSIIDTGIADVKDMMELNVPHGLQAIGVIVLLMGIETLGFHAAANARIPMSLSLVFGATQS